MSYQRGKDRQEVQLLPACLDDYVAAESSVRFLDAYVESLDFVALGFTRSQPRATGRPPYHPADLLKLYLYGYLHRLRSSRRLEAEAGRNLEVLWLLRTVRPDFKTIANFRKDNHACFKGVLREFNLLCRKLGLFGAELVVIDGSKFRALNSPEGSLSVEQMQQIITQIDERIEDYLRQLESADREAEAAAAAVECSGDDDNPRQGEPSGDSQELQQQIDKLRATLQQQRERIEQMQQSGSKRAYLHDRDARPMCDRQQGVVRPGYNVQIAVDGKHHLIVAQEVVQDGNDRGQLGDLAVAAKAVLEVASLQVVADRGYYAAQQLEICEQHGMDAFVPAPRTTSGRSTKDGRPLFGRERFVYDEQAGVYWCPGGHALKQRATCNNKGHLVQQYVNTAACRQCPLKAQCTDGKHRQIGRLVNEAVVERTAARVAQQPQLLQQRKKIVEHVFGTLKQWGYGVFSLCGLPKVRGEFSLSALAYNLKRVLTLVPLPMLMNALPKAS